MDKTCKRCGKSGLVWKKAINKWSLANKDGTFHVCGRVGHSPAGTPVGNRGYVSDGVGCVEKVREW